MSSPLPATVEPERFLPVRRRHQGTEGLTELVFRAFFGGDDASAEYAARLAHQGGVSLMSIYESLRAQIYRWSPDAAPAQAISLALADERLARVAMRLTAPMLGRIEPEALILRTLHQGICAGLTHIYGDMGIPATTLDLSTIARARRHGIELGAQFPRIRYLVLEATHCGPQELAKHLGFLQDQGLIGSRLSVSVLTDEDLAFGKFGFHTLDHFAMVDTIPALLAAAGLFAENPLTAREQDTLRLVSQGATNQQAARALGISIATVKTYIERSQAKLNTCDRASAVATAMRRGWI